MTTGYQNSRRALYASVAIQRTTAAQRGPTLDRHLRVKSNAQPALLRFPNGNRPTETDAAFQKSPRAGGESPVEGCAVVAASARRIGANHSVLFARPHPYLDASRFRADYDPIPSWLYYGTELLSDEALAVIATYPPDLPAITSMFLPALGFAGPFTIVPVVAELGTEVAHSHVTVLARRPGAPPLPQHFRRVRGEVLLPHTLAKRLIPVAKQGLQLFAPNIQARHDPFDDLALNWFRIRGRSNWTPWGE